MKATAAALIFFFALLTQAEEPPLNAWQFTPANADKNIVKPAHGPYAGTIVGPHEFQAENPPCLKLSGNKSRVDFPADPKTAEMPKQNLSAEAWVMLDRTQEWGGILGAMQHNGPYQKRLAARL